MLSITDDGLYKIGKKWNFVIIIFQKSDILVRGTINY